MKKTYKLLNGLFATYLTLSAPAALNQNTTKTPIASKPQARKVYKNETISNTLLPKAYSMSVKELSKLPFEARKDKFFEIIDKAVEDYSRLAKTNVSKEEIKETMKSIAIVESTLNPLARRADNYGLTQLSAYARKKMGIKNPFDPQENINGGVQWFYTILEESKDDLSLAIRKYNDGYRALMNSAKSLNYLNKVRRTRKTYFGN